MPQTEPKERRPIIGDWMIFVLLVISLAGNVYLGLRSGRSAPSEVGPGAQDPLKPGTVIAQLAGKSLSGSPMSLSLKDGRPTVVFAYSPTCQWCKKTWPAFQEIAKQRANKYRFVALCYGDPSTAFPADFTVITRPTADTTASLKLPGVPETVVFSPAGAVERVWFGAYQGRQREEVGQFFGLALP